jgi:hypothetical protein
MESLRKLLRIIKMYLSTETIFEGLDLPNKNGRIYTREALEKAIAEWEGKEMLGTIGMPPNDRPVDINMVSHIITNLHIDGDKVTGTIKVLDTPLGIELQKLIDSKTVEVAYRSAGMGNIIEQEDGTCIVEDYHITSVNVVNKEKAA